MTTLSAGVSSITGLDAAGRDLVADPRDNLVQHVLERRHRLEAEHRPRLADVRYSHLHVVLVRRIRDEPQRAVAAVGLAPHDLGELAYRRRARSRQVEVFVERLLRLHREPDAVRKVAAVGVVAHLVAVPEYVQRFLAFQNLLHQVGHHVTHGELDVAAPHVMVAQRAALADAHAVEGTQDRERQGVLLVRAPGEVFGRELLKAVRRPGRRARHLRALRCGEDRGRLEDHAAGQHGDLPETAVAKRAHRCVEGGSADALVLGQQVVGELVEIRDAADHRGPGDDMVAVHRELGQEPGVLGVAVDQAVARIVVKRPRDRAVLAEVVDADHLVPGVEKLGDQVPANKTSCAGDEDLQRRMGPVTPQMSTTSRPSSSSLLYARCGAPTTITSDSRSTLSSGWKVGSAMYGSVHSTLAPLNWASLRSL